MKLEEAEKLLPPKIIKDMKEAFREYKLTEAQKEKAIDKVVDIYNKSCFEPGEAMGVIAAQSISEPATQMSLAAEERILVKEKGLVQPLEIGSFVNNLMNKFEPENVSGSEILDLPDDLIFMFTA